MKDYTVYGIMAVILTASFTALKLDGIIGWSWLWIVSPIWLPFAIFAVLLSIAYLIRISLSLTG